MTNDIAQHETKTCYVMLRLFIVVPVMGFQLTPERTNKPSSTKMSESDSNFKQHNEPKFTWLTLSIKWVITLYNDFQDLLCPPYAYIGNKYHIHIHIHCRTPNQLHSTSGLVVGIIIISPTLLYSLLLLLLLRAIAIYSPGQQKKIDYSAPIRDIELKFWG